MSVFYASAMITIMALVLFGAVIPLGGVNPILIIPALFFTTLLVLASAGKKLLHDNKEATSHRAQPMDWAVVCFLAYSVGRYFTSPFEYEARNELLQVILCGLVYLTAANEFFRARDRTVFIAAIIILAVFQSAYGMWQAFTYSDSILFWERPESYNGRGSGTFVCPNHLAGFLELALGLIVARAVIVRRESRSVEKSVIIKVLVIYAAIMAVAGVLVSFSRAGMAATVVGLSALVFLGEWRWRAGLARAAVALVVLGFMGFMLWNVHPIRDYLLKTFPVDEKTRTVSLRDPSVGGRVMMWTGTLKMIQDTPWFGTGIGSWQWIYQQYKKPDVTASEPDYTHNDYLNLAADYGLAGAALMLAVFVCFFRHALAVAKNAETSEQRAFAIGAMISVISILVHSWFDFNLHIPANSILLAAIMGFTGAMTDPKRVRQLHPPSRVPALAMAVVMLMACGLAVRMHVPTVLGFHYTDMGNAAAVDLEYESAFANYQRASNSDPKYARPHIKTGDIYLSQANWRKGMPRSEERRSLAQKAIEAYEAALRLNPYQAYVRVSLARAYELAGEDDLALRNYKQAIETAPINAYAHYMLGCFYRDRGRDEEASGFFSKADEYFCYGEPIFQINAWEARERQGSAQPK